MKMSKQERIALLIFLVVLTLGVGFFMFIMPVVDKINANDLILKNKRTELSEYKATQATKDGLKDEVIEAFKDGQNEANMFFEEMTPYQADNELRAFIDYCQNNLGINILVEDLKVSEPGVQTLGVEFYDESSIEYELKDFATQGVEMSEEEAKKLADEQERRAKLSGSQTVGAITATIKVYVKDPVTAIDFMDAVNNYYKNDGAEGESIRKALKLNGFEYSWDGIEVEEDNPNANAEGQSLNSTSEEDKPKPVEIDASITFYSIVRMQDPAEQLEAQEAAAQ